MSQSSDYGTIYDSVCNAIMTKRFCGRVGTSHLLWQSCCRHTHLSRMARVTLVMSPAAAAAADGKVMVVMVSAVCIMLAGCRQPVVLLLFLLVHPKNVNSPQRRRQEAQKLLLKWAPMRMTIWDK